MCNVKGVACGDKPTEHYHPQVPAALLSLSTHCFDFLRPAASLFWFNLTAFINLVSSRNRQ